MGVNLFDHVNVELDREIDLNCDLFSSGEVECRLTGISVRDAEVYFLYNGLITNMSTGTTAVEIRLNLPDHCVSLNIYLRNYNAMIILSLYSRKDTIK